MEIGIPRPPSSAYFKSHLSQSHSILTQEEVGEYYYYYLYLMSEELNPRKVCDLFRIMVSKGQTCHRNQDS